MATRHLTRFSLMPNGCGASTSGAGLVRAARRPSANVFRAAAAVTRDPASATTFLLPRRFASTSGKDSRFTDGIPRPPTAPKYEDHRNPEILPPSIFNDVLGPVMRGPSSSHSAAALRIGRLSLDLMQGDLKKALVEYDPNGSLVTTHSGQGSDMGLYGGFLGWDADDEKLEDFKEHINAAGIETEIQYVSYDAEHPNTYKLTLWDSEGSKREVMAISTGGGMIEMQSIDGFPVTMYGDAHETVVFADSAAEAEEGLGWALRELGDNDDVDIRGDVVEDPAGGGGGGKAMLSLKTSAPVPADTLQMLREMYPGKVRSLSPVLPTLSRSEVKVPFLTATKMLETNAREGGLPFWRLAAKYEAQRGGSSEEEVFEKMRALVKIMRDAVTIGRAGTVFEDRILPCQSLGFEKEMNRGGLIPGDVINSIILYVTAIMEVKSSMGVFVASPTAGSAGALPGAVLAVADQLGKSDDEVVEAMLVAGLVGAFIAEHATFAAEVAGCMAECGSGSGMAAAAITTLGGGDVNQSLGAASLALQSSMGMTCDPIANRVEAPCLGKNVVAATNALSCSNMALAGFRHLIPLDEVLVSFYQVGQSLPEEVRCTGKGGLAITPTAQMIEAQMGDERYDWESQATKKIAC